jgi:hypothetical protein
LVIPEKREKEGTCWRDEEDEIAFKEQQHV